jgi:hypothetical protein
VAIAIGPVTEAGKPVKTSTANALKGVVYLWDLCDIPEANDSGGLRLFPTKTFVGRGIKARQVLLTLSRSDLHAVSKPNDGTCVITRLSGGLGSKQKVIGTFQYDYDFPLTWCRVYDPYVNFHDDLGDEASVLVPISDTETRRIILDTP